VSGIGVSVGPVVGGLLLDRFWWGSVFLVNVPIVVLAVVFGQMLIPPSKDPTAKKTDFVGSVLSIAGFSVLLWGIIGAPERGWGDPATVGAFAAACVVLGGFAVWELRSEHPMLDLTFFRRPRFTVAMLAITLGGLAMAGEIFILTQLLQFVMGFSPLGAGLRVAPWAIVLLVFGPLSPRLAERFGSKAMVTFGLTVSAIGMTMFAFTGVDSSYWYVLGAIMTVATGAALYIAPATESIMGAIPREKAGSGSAINNTTRQIGTALGVAVIGGIFVSGYRSGVDGRAGALGLTGSRLESARASVGSAMKVAREIGGRTGAEIVDAAKHSFVHGLHLGVGVAAALCLFGAVLAFVYLPARAPHHELDATEYLPVEMMIDPDELDAVGAPE
jgi:MFS family permease